METITTALPARRPGILWGWVTLAAVLSEAGVILVLLAVTSVYSLWLAPGQTDEHYNEFAEQAGYYVAPAAGALTTFLCVLWLGRKLKARFVANGVLVGVVSVLLTAGFVLGARPEHRWMYGLAFALRILAGYAGGVTAGRMAAAR